VAGPIQERSNNFSLTQQRQSPTILYVWSCSGKHPS